MNISLNKKDYCWQYKARNRLLHLFKVSARDLADHLKKIEGSTLCLSMIPYIGLGGCPFIWSNSTNTSVIFQMNCNQIFSKMAQITPSLCHPSSSVLQRLPYPPKNTLENVCFCFVNGVLDILVPRISKWYANFIF